MSVSGTRIADSMPTIDLGQQFNRLVDPPLWAVTARSGEQRGGLIATFVQNASLVPDAPRLVVGVATQHHTWRLIDASKAFALHLLTEEHLDWVTRLGLRSGRDGGDKLHGLPAREGRTGAPILEGGLLWAECRVEAALDTGGRTVFLVAAVDGGSAGSGAPLRFGRMLDLLRPDQRDEMRRQLARDVEIDAAAIRAWRAAQGVRDEG